MVAPAASPPAPHQATRDRLDGRRMLKEDRATTRRVMLILVVAVMVILTSGCSAHRGAGAHSKLGGNSGFRVARHTTTGTVSCDTLVGQSVNPHARCGNSANSASAGCYQSGKRHGDYYWIDTGTGSFVYGRPGSTWQTGPQPLSRGQMAKQLGCS